jgi:hypothetical protein
MTNAEDTAESESEVKRFRATRIGDFSKAKEMWLITTNTLTEELGKIVCAAASMLEGNSIADQILTELKEAPAEIHTVKTSFDAAIKTLEAKFAAAESTVKLKEFLMALKELVRGDNKKLVGVRKNIAVLRGLIKKKETASLKGVAVGSDQQAPARSVDGDASAALLQHFRNCACAADRSLGCKGFSEFDKVSPCYAKSDNLAKFNEMKFMPVLRKWLTEQLGAKESP